MSCCCRSPRGRASGGGGPRGGHDHGRGDRRRVCRRAVSSLHAGTDQSWWTRELSDAKISPNSIGYINAHATGTKIGDFEEAKAIYEVFGSTPLVTSTKALTGHEMWMAGASELIYSIIMLVLGYIPPQHNFIEGDEVTSKLNIPTRFNAAKHDYMMSNSFGFGGTNCSIIIKRYERQS